MKIAEFMKQLYDATDSEAEAYVRQRTCDTLKAGDPEQEVTKIATAMFATPQVIREAAAWGANLLIVHEPTFYAHWDDLSELETMEEPDKSLIKAKLEFIKKHNMTIFRYHDHPHRRFPDMISKGEVKYWGLKGTWKKGSAFGINEFTLDEPMPVLELAKSLEKNLNIHSIRIVGSRKTLCKTLSLSFGSPGRLGDSLSKFDVVLTGEICEWSTGEFVRDYAELIQEKSLLVMGHVGSERDGMRLLVDFIHENFPAFEAKYFECGEVYSYTK